MNYAQMASDIRQKFFDAWDLTAYAADQVLQENNPEKTDPTKVWIRMVILVTDRYPSAVGNKCWRTTGQIKYQIFVPSGGGDNEARLRADAIGIIFEGTQFDGISTISVEYFGQVGMNGEFAQFNLDVNFRVDEIK